MGIETIARCDRGCGSWAMVEEEGLPKGWANAEIRPAPDTGGLIKMVVCPDCRDVILHIPKKKRSDLGTHRKPAATTVSEEKTPPLLKGDEELPDIGIVGIGEAHKFHPNHALGENDKHGKNVYLTCLCGKKKTDPIHKKGKRRPKETPQTASGSEKVVDSTPGQNGAEMPNCKGCDVGPINCKVKADVKSRIDCFEKKLDADQIKEV